MKEEDFWIFIRDFVDYLDAQEKAIKRLKEQIARLAGSNPAEHSGYSKRHISRIVPNVTKEAGSKAVSSKEAKIEG